MGIWMGRGCWVGLWLGVGLSSPALGEGSKLDQLMEREIQQSRVKKDELGIMVSSFANGTSLPVYELNAAKPFIPASLTKIIAAGGVLDGLGPSLKLETHLLAADPIENGELKGNLYLRGGGDPGFVSETMWFLVNAFLRSGVRKIAGSVVVDDGRFDQIRTDPSRVSDRVDRAFDAPVGAMSFNWNSVNIFVRPGAKSGDAPKVFLDPENTFTRLINNARTTGANDKQDVQVEKINGSSGKGDSIRVSGSIGLQAKEMVSYKNISDPALWSAHNLVGFLKQRGVEVAGGVKIGSTPAKAESLAKAESKPLALQITDMMKFSNNFVAEMLVKNLAAEKVKTPARLEDGMELLKKFMADHGVPAGRFTLVNPSGFTRENKIWPKDLHHLLVEMRKHFSFFPEMLASYPLAGADGTLKSRMKGTAAEGHIRAKTGRLNGVIGLAGYAGRPDGSLSVFVFLFNGRASHAEDARVLFDRMAVRLVE